ncbi:MAG TPA: DUF58 domain-containing protein [Gammaproteobacteria bacterium]|nr:DUF58 domain-containing protein [Gammaproteobacteria bacterium]
MRNLAGRLAGWAAEWARRRQGEDRAAVTLRWRRIYILPTRYGLGFALLVFAMLLGSMNYSTSLGFALAFLLAGLGLVVMHHCHNNLLGVRLRFLGAPPVFAGEEARFRFSLENDGALPRYEIELAQHGQDGRPADVEPGGSAVLELALPGLRRGWQRIPRFSVATRHPGNLFRAWTWIHMEARCLVYPAPAVPGRPVPRTASSGDDGAGRREDPGNADFVGLRAAVPGDSPRRIAWKAYASSGQLLLKQFAGADPRPELFDWDSLSGLDPEQRLAQLTRWCLDARAAGQSFGLSLPGQRIPLGSGDRHLHACLEALALFDGSGRAHERPAVREAGP